MPLAASTYPLLNVSWSIFSQVAVDEQQGNGSRDEPTLAGRARGRAVAEGRAAQASPRASKLRTGGLAGLACGAETWDDWAK